MSTTTTPATASSERLHPEEAGVLTTGGGPAVTVKWTVDVAVLGTESEAVITSV